MPLSCLFSTKEAQRTCAWRGAALQTGPSLISTSGDAAAGCTRARCSPQQPRPQLHGRSVFPPSFSR
jgi:hypothetical protein